MKQLVRISNLCLLLILTTIIIACNKTTTQTTDKQSNKINIDITNTLDDLSYGLEKDSLEFVISQDTIILAKNYVEKVLDSFPKFKLKNAKHPDTLFYNFDGDYYYSEGEADGVYLVYACVQDEINTTNDTYEDLLSDLIKIHQHCIDLAVSKRNLGTYYTHQRVRLFAESVYQARIDMDLENYNDFTLKEEKEAYFDSISVEALKLFDERIPYEYWDSKAKEKELRQKLINNLAEVEAFIDSDYKFKNFKAIY
jgi:hypothetical protein